MTFKCNSPVFQDQPWEIATDDFRYGRQYEQHRYFGEIVHTHFKNS